MTKSPLFSLFAFGLAAGGWLAAGASAQAGETVIRGQAARTALLELYTSEGCSSCPPAETWLSEWRNNPRLWKDAVPVAFHVDYWDYLGWRDRFASAAYTARQRAQAARWQASTVYTPGFALNGGEWARWSSSPKGNLPPDAGHEETGPLTIRLSEDRRSATVVFEPASGAKAPRECTVALLGFGLDSAVKAGENNGRRLRHDFVALALESKPLKTAAGNTLEATIALPETPKDATKLAVAAWVNPPGEVTRIEQAAGGWIAQ